MDVEPPLLHPIQRTAVDAARSLLREAREEAVCWSGYDQNFRRQLVIVHDLVGKALRSLGSLE